MAESRADIRPYTQEEWRMAVILFVTTALTHALTFAALPPATMIYPAGAVALAGLFFNGPRLWPAPFLALLLVELLIGSDLPLVYLLPVGLTVAAAIGARLLRETGIDPLFRRYRDTFYIILTSLLISLIVPTLALLAPESVYPTWRWIHGYVATLFSLLVVTPFLLRWTAKLRFRRPVDETAEILVVFGLLIGVNILLFTLSITKLFGVFLIYALLVPFFWIAIRLRPRFVTLAILVTSGFALHSVLANSSPDTLLNELYAAELFLLALAMSFYTIVSLEEDRRLNTNLMRSQLASLENAVSRISSESQAKNDFIAILAHELRNPLAPVVSAIELMKIKGSRDHEEAESLEVMEASMQTVRRLLDDLLDISRISEGKIAIKREVLDIGHIVRRAIVSTAHHFKERHQTLTFKGSPAPLHVEGDPVRLEQIFSNLLTNASKYSPSGQPVSLTVSGKDGMAEIVVRDQGIGIPQDSLDTIFLPFHQLEPGKQSKKGLGIGLALVHSFVQMHDGRISVTSEGEGKGSAFTVRLPLVDEKPSEDRIPRARTEVATERNGPRVLVVDDNDAAAAGIGRLLELQGCTVSYAYDGDQALREAGASPHEVIILDIGMQGQDGYTVARKLRTRGYDGLLIALSGFSTPEARQKGQEAGFDHYLVKPAGISELRKVIPALS